MVTKETQADFKWLIGEMEKLSGGANTGYRAAMVDAAIDELNSHGLVVQEHAEAFAQNNPDFYQWDEPKSEHQAEKKEELEEWRMTLSGTDRDTGDAVDKEFIMYMTNKTLSAYYDTAAQLGLGDTIGGVNKGKAKISGKYEFTEPDHERILAEIRRQLDFYKGQAEEVYKEYEDKLRKLMQEYEIASAGGTYTKGSFAEPSACPVIPEASEMIGRSAQYMAEKKPQDTNDAEVASIGHDYTYHTHPRGTPQPSEADINTTTQLGKRFLCIGLVPNKEVICWDMQEGGVSCRHPA